MFERILVPLDGSPRAELILAQLRPVLQRQDAEIILVRAVFVPPSLARGDPGKLVEREEAAWYLRNAERRLAEQGVRARGIVCEGPPAETLLEAAQKERATLIAMTTHGRFGLARWALGSVAEKVIRGSERPVLVMRSFQAAPDGAVAPVGGGAFPFRKIMVPTDGSENALAVLPCVIEFARFFDAAVVVLAVEEGPVSPAGAFTGAGVEAGTLRPSLEPAQEASGAAAEKLAAAGLRVVTRTVAGDVASQIVDQSRNSGVDLIAMATHGHSGGARWVLGSVTEKVLRAATVPMLVVRS